MTFGLGLTVTGGQALADRLNLLSKAVRTRALRKVLRAAAEPIRGRASELAPIDPSTELDLKDWIVISAVTKIGSLEGARSQAADEFQAAVAVGPATKVFYGLYLEYGTVKMRPQPFLRPAFDYGLDRSLSILRDGLWDLVEQANANAGVFKETDA